MGAARRFIDRSLDRWNRVPEGVALPPDERMEAFKRFGDHSLAYGAATQSGMRYHGDRNGFIAFGALMGQAVALGDPIAPPEGRASLLRSFVEGGGRPSFAGVSRPVAEALAALGYRATQMGIDSGLDLAAYEFSGGSKKPLRHAETWLRGRGYRIGEASEFPGLADQLPRLSREWRGERVVKRREMTFLNRAYPNGEDPLMRRFVLLGPEGELQALMFFDPICRDGAVVGYLTSIKRRARNATTYAELGLTKHVIGVFQAEGRERLMLGLSPLAGLAPSGFPESRFFHRALRRLYASRFVNDRVFNVQGHAAFKARFHGREEPLFFAWAKGSPLLPFIATLRLSKAI